MKTTCIRGHAFTADNSYIRKNGSRNCIKCKQLRQHKAWLIRKQRKPSPRTIVLNKSETVNQELFNHVLTIYRPPLPCPRCGRLTDYARITSRQSLSCYICGYHVSPMAETKIFKRTKASLTAWRTAHHLLQSNPVVTTQMIADAIGYPYKTAYRIRQQIKLYPNEAELYLS